jgi:hypothetical protein
VPAVSEQTCRTRPQIAARRTHHKLARDPEKWEPVFGKDHVHAEW